MLRVVRGLCRGWRRNKLLSRTKELHVVIRHASSIVIY